jgi:hypothetical protein
MYGEKEKKKRYFFDARWEENRFSDTYVGKIRRFVSVAKKEKENRWWSLLIADIDFTIFYTSKKTHSSLENVSAITLVREKKYVFKYGSQRSVYF